MLTTQIQVLLYVGNIQVISCSVFVPVPSIVVKSHQTLEAILPYLPLSLTAAEPEDHSGPDPSVPQTALPAPPDSHSHSTALTSPSTSSSSSHSTALVLSSKQDIIPPLPSRNTTNSNNSNNNNARRQQSSSSSNSNRISPDSSIPATTCIKISLQPTPSFKFVKPKCPHQQQKNRNRRHFHQQQQQQQHPSSHSHHSHSHSHSHHSHSHSHSHHSHNHSHSHRSDSNRHNSSSTNMASLEYPPQTATNIAAAGTVTVKFTYPIPSTTDSTTTIPELVQVTGTFNAWQRSQPLTCNQDRTLFEADISIDIASLPQGSDNSNSSKMQKEDPSRKKILFKFVLDGQNWVTDPDQPTERDYAGNLNNVLFVDISTATTATITTDTKEAVSTPSAVTETKTEAETETEEERAARLKQEEEDEETIRQLGGGMWGAPFFAVNDPIALPEHFTPADDAAENKEVSTVPLTTTTASKEQEKEAEASVAAVAQNVVEGGASIQSVVQETKPTPILADSISESSSSSTPEQQRQPEEHKVEGKKGEEVEDEDDRIIKELGGGMWGTPFFKVNDPAALPEHFQEALSASTSSSVPVVETVTDKDGDSPRHSIQIVKDEITTKIEGGTLFETVVETTEDIVIEAADGTFLEESITTSVEETVSGVIDEEVTEIIETIEEEEAPAAAANTKVVVEDEGAIKFVETVEEQTDDNKIPAGASTPEVTMTETETTTLVQGEDGVETTIVEDTLTFTDGPEVDASSLHSLTTVTKPVTDGESVAVEQAPEVLVENSVAAVASPGDAKPSVDESVEPLPSLSSATTATTTITTTTTATGLSTPSNEQQESDSVVLLSSQKPQEVVAGDAKPTADLSVATTVLTPNLIVDTKSTLPNHLTSAAPTAFTTTETAATTTVAPTTEKSGKTEKGEKRKSFWKKVKKVLS